MTLEQKIALCSGKDFWHTKAFPDSGIPSIMLCDGPHGLRKQENAADMLGVNQSVPATCFPTASLSACSFDTELLAEEGRAIAAEAAAQDVAVVLGPGVCLKRNPLCGRNPEYFSEDPYLAGMLAAAFAKGLESTGVHGCYKHLVANNAEASRKRNDSVMDESTLRNLYLRSFEIALRAYEPAGMMTSYNLLNGCYTSTDPELVLGVLRREWNFKGFVMTDWGSYLTADTVQMINAGVSWITPCSSDDTYTAPLEKAAEEGRLDIRRLRENVSWMLKTIMK